MSDMASSHIFLVPGVVPMQGVTGREVGGEPLLLGLGRRPQADLPSL